MKKHHARLHRPDAKIFNKISASARSIPNFLNLPKGNCLECETKFDVDYLAERPPLGPVLTNDGRLFRRAGIVLTCPNCNKPVDFSLPLSNYGSINFFYGDEAFRLATTPQIYCYGMVGIKEKDHELLKSKIDEIKQKHAPHIHPDSWRIHMTELKSPEGRKKNPSQLSEDGYRALISDIADFFCIPGMYLYPVAAVAMVHRKSGDAGRAQEEFCKRDLYNHLILMMTELAGSSEVQPHFIFDADKPVSGEEAIQGWARDEFLGLHKSLVFSFISRGIPVPEPKFVQPGSETGLELADVIAYTTATYLNRATNKQKQFLDPASFGPMTYIVADPKGNFQTKYQQGFPWQIFEDSTCT